MKKELPEKFCVLPFIHAVYNTYDKNEENCRVKPCCRFDNFKYENKNPNDPLNTSPLFLKLQEQFLNGEMPEGCKTCWSTEDAGNKSYRQDMLDQYHHLIDNEAYKEKSLRYLEIMPGNACQLACRMCSSLFSSKWGEIDLPNIEIHKNKDQKYAEWKSLDLSKLETLKLMGGEPTYQKKHIALLEHLDSLGRLPFLEIQVPLNLHDPLSDKWKKFLEKSKFVKLDVSIDGVGKLNEYVRQYSNWDRWYENFKDLILFAKNKNILVKNSTTITSYNINQSKEIEQFLLEYDLEVTDQFCTFYPPYLDVRHLSDNAKQYLLDNDLVTSSVRNVLELSFGHYNSLMLEKLNVYIKDLDDYHKTSFKEVNPQMAEIINLQ